MAHRIWPGRCEDCYNVRALQTVKDNTVPTETSAQLCASCIAQRRRITEQGIEPPAIGLLLGITWQEARLVMVQGETRTDVAIKFLHEGVYAGTVRIHFGNEPAWLTAGEYGATEQLALSNARHFLRTKYFPNAKISFE